MITLLTGLPGNGKTLFALWFVKQKAERENREVYYHNIKDLTLPWTVCDPEKWMDLPHGSIIVLDECQFVFSKKPNGSKLPDYYDQLATHRHKGFDIFLITQHPSLVDNFVRQLVGQHFHAVRKFGLDRATLYEWSALNPGPQLASSQKSAISLKWGYPKEVYTYYKSAEVHTVKKSIPAKLILACAFVVAVPLVGYYALSKYQDRGKVEPQASQVGNLPGAVPVASVMPSSAPSPAQPVDPVADAKQYLFNQTPRLAGLPHTAPKYDPITVPVRAPIPAACIQIGTPLSDKGIRCKCFSQQGTALDVEFNMCISFARNGWFKDFDEGKGGMQGELAASEAKSKGGAEVMAARPDDGRRASVIAFNETASNLVSPIPQPAQQPPAPRVRHAVAN